MSVMLWSEESNTGVDVIDSQHRELVDMLNRAAPVLQRSSQDSMQAATSTSRRQSTSGVQRWPVFLSPG